MADMSGCSIFELSSKLSSDELMMRITNRLMLRGWSFDREEIEEHKNQERKREREAFMNRARAYWSSN